MDKDRIIINKEILKAIAADSRLNILKLLHNRKYTLSELSEKLDLSNATVKEHLDILLDVDLIRKKSTNRKFKYYSLTFKGKNIVSPKQIKAFVTFVICSIITIGLGFLFLNSYFGTIASPTSYSKNLDSKIQKASNIGIKEASNIKEQEEIKDVRNKDQNQSSFINNLDNKNNLIYLLLLSLSLSVTIIFLINYVNYKNKKFEV